MQLQNKEEQADNRIILMKKKSIDKRRLNLGDFP
jgi:hypothetical protein